MFAVDESQPMCHGRGARTKRAFAARFQVADDQRGA